jgi:hypothetical protein
MSPVVARRVVVPLVWVLTRDLLLTFALVVV